MNRKIYCDILVVGSGASGSVVSNKLSSEKYDVLMVEEGPNISTDKFNSSLSESLRTIWRNGGINSIISNPPIAYSEGCCLGGSTEINSAIFQNPIKKLITEWEEKYSIQNFKFETIEKNINFFRKKLNVSNHKFGYGNSSLKFSEGAKNLNWEVSELERSQNFCVGTNMCTQGCPTGAKQSMSNTLIPEAKKNGLRILHNCKVEKIYFKGDQAISVKILIKENGKICYKSIYPNTIFLCAGAIETPFLLLKSGIKKNVGNSLSLHPTVRLAAKYPYKINSDDNTLPLYAITEFMPNIRIGGSIFSPSTLSLNLSDNWAHNQKEMKDWEKFALFYSMIRPTGLGSVKKIFGLNSPIITFKFSKSDEQFIKKSLNLVSELAFASGALKVFPSIRGVHSWSKNMWLKEKDKINTKFNNFSLMTIHLFGSCRIGDNIDKTSLDSFGRVHGIKNLWVADASQIPEAPGTNPQALIMSLALRTTEHFLQQ